jgi:hypothetical protein
LSTVFRDVRVFDATSSTLSPPSDVTDVWMPIIAAA